MFRRLFGMGEPKPPDQDKMMASYWRKRKGEKRKRPKSKTIIPKLLAFQLFMILVCFAPLSFLGSIYLALQIPKWPLGGQHFIIYLLGAIAFFFASCFATTGAVGIIWWWVVLEEEGDTDATE